MCKLSMWASKLFFLAPIMALMVGCPVFDPHTQSQIVNNTGDTIEIELVLDRAQWRYGFNPDEYESWLGSRTSEWIGDELRVYADRGGGVELIKVDTDRFAGHYLLAPRGAMIVDDSMGTQTTIRFSKLLVMNERVSLEFNSEQEILHLFQPVAGMTGLYQFIIENDTFADTH